MGVGVVLQFRARGLEETLMHTRAPLSVGLGEDGHHLLLDVIPGVLEVADDVVTQSSPLLWGHHIAIEDAVAGSHDVGVGVGLFFAVAWG